MSLPCWHVLVIPATFFACWQGVCTFNDDIQSTAAAVLGAIYGGLRLEGVPPLREQRFLFFGAGQANIGTARLLVAALADEGASEQEAKQQIFLYDSKVNTDLLTANSDLHVALIPAVACHGYLKHRFCMTHGVWIYSAPLHCFVIAPTLPD